MDHKTFNKSFQSTYSTAQTLYRKRCKGVKSYVPQRVVAHIQTGLAARAELIEGAVLFADVSGFTALSESLKHEFAQGI